MAPKPNVTEANLHEEVDAGDAVGNEIVEEFDLSEKYCDVSAYQVQRDVLIYIK